MPKAAIVALGTAFRLAGRELRGGVRGFRVFLACLVLGVGAIAAIGSLRAAVEAGLRADARLLLGGDVSARLTLRPANAAERDFLAKRRHAVRDRELCARWRARSTASAAA